MLKIALISLLLILFPLQGEARESSKKILSQLAREARDASTSAPKDNEACFAPDEPCAAKLIRFIQTAKASLDIAIFEMTDQKIAKAIADASSRLKVRVVVNPKLAKEDSPTIEILRSSKAEIRIGRQKGIMHNKFTIVDEKRLETGSFNYTYAAGNSNQENQLYLSTPSIVTRYQERFEKMWREAKH